MLAQPESTDHQCQDDQFIVSGGSPIPAICGTNSGAHSKMRYELLFYQVIILTVLSEKLAHFLNENFLLHFQKSLN